MKRLLFVPCCLLATFVLAEPRIPAGDAEVLERLAFPRSDPAAQELQALRRAHLAAPGAPATGHRFDEHPDAGALVPPSTLGTLAQHAREGVWHIWIGFDHVLFLLSLLLPAVLVPQRLNGSRAWAPVGRARDAFWGVLKVVTAFTVAHSITLSAAALGWVSLPSRLVESVIAASVVLAALNNVRPLVGEGRWMVAFAFGLVHGFGFASVLADLGLPESSLLAALLGFNVGVELGQLAIVCVFLPVAYAVRETTIYRHWVLHGGSVAIAGLAALWFVERAFDWKIFG